MFRDAAVPTTLIALSLSLSACGYFADFKDEGSAVGGKKASSTVPDGSGGRNEQSSRAGTAASQPSDGGANVGSGGVTATALGGGTAQGGIASENTQIAQGSAVGNANGGSASTGGMPTGGSSTGTSNGGTSNGGTSNGGASNSSTLSGGTSRGGGSSWTGGNGGMSGTATPQGGASGASSGGAPSSGGSANSGAGGVSSSGGANASGGTGTGGTVAVLPPEITSFTADYNKVCSGSSATLRAQFANGTGTVSGVGAIVSGEAKSSSAVTADTTFTLTVTNSAAFTVQASVSVTVLKSGEFTPTGSPIGIPISGLGSRALSPDGRALTITTPASGTCQIEQYNVNSGLFTSLGTATKCGNITPLKDGRVLVAGGQYSAAADPLAASLFDPGTGQSTATSPLSQAREKDIPVLLSQSGKVLIVGGDWGGELYIRDTAELFDPGQGTNGAFSLLTLQSERVLHTATALGGNRVLVTGGVIGPNWQGPIVASAELYDPSVGGTGAFVATGSMSAARAEHSAVLLQDGRVLVTGGQDNLNAIPRMATSELYDPSTGKFVQTGTLYFARARHSMALMSNGRVLVVGGDDNNSFEVFNPITEKTSVSIAAAPKTKGGLLALPNGSVLLVGADGSGKSSAELYCP